MIERLLDLFLGGREEQRFPTDSAESGYGGEEASEDTNVPPETVVMRLLREAEGHLKQQQLLDRTGWPPSTLSKRLSDLEEQGHIERFKVGREKIVCLPDDVPELLSRDRDDEIPLGDRAARGPTVLVAEDDPAERLLLQEAFSDCDRPISPLFVTEGPAVLAALAKVGEYARTPRPQLVILDVDLPEWDGIEVLRRLRANDEWQSIPVVMLSNRDDSATISECYEAGANAYLTKPGGYEEYLTLATRLAEFWLDHTEHPYT